mmetsp:Transcript_23276/g.43748  ORF Transcript_23276/g.43748 Transcript_23276/m.43748 type:complete len:150 (-) Transcript_23276:68-517(-)
MAMQQHGEFGSVQDGMPFPKEGYRPCKSLALCSLGRRLAAGRPPAQDRLPAWECQRWKTGPPPVQLEKARSFLDSGANRIFRQPHAEIERAPAPKPPALGDRSSSLPTLPALATSADHAASWNRPGQRKVRFDDRLNEEFLVTYRRLLS